MPAKVWVRVTDTGDEPVEQTFSTDFRIGRDPDCELCIDSGLVSRVHARVVCESGRWWIRDNNSSNGMYVDGKRTESVVLRNSLSVQIARNGPVIDFRVVGTDPEEAVREIPHTDPALLTHRQTQYESPFPRKSGRPVSEESFIGKYFSDDGPAGEHTMHIRRAYRSVNQKQKKRYGVLLSVAAFLIIAAVSYAIVQQIHINRQKQQIDEVFMTMREQDVQIARLRRIVEETGNAELEMQLAELEEIQRRRAVQYAGLVRELGVYRRLRDDERLMWSVARVFNESEVVMPGEFVRAVRETIHEHWLGPGRMTFETAIRRAEENGYTEHIVRTMYEQGLPPHFFYLALQESVFNPNAIGIETRWGIAKGMWQFIPGTATRYGLRIGPYAESRVVDPQDERLDFEQATEAAARYLADIYRDLAQASGLLVMASYNWGEHRVARGLSSIDFDDPREAQRAFFDGIPQDPQSRNYWRFLEEHSSRMPAETKDYVLKIFAAAVIGENPRAFGFDFDNPLIPYMESLSEENVLAHP